MKTIFSRIPKWVIISIIILFLVEYSLLFYFSFFHKAKAPQSEDPNAIYTQAAEAIFAEMTETAANQTIQPTPIPEKSEALTVEKNLFDVEVTIPSILLSDMDMSTFDPDSYAKKYGFNKAILNNDGSITVSMSKSKHNELLTAYAADITDSFNQIVGSAETPYINGISCNSDFSQVFIDVDRIAYKSTFDLTPLVIGISSMYYQAIAGIEIHCEVIIRDKDTVEIISTVIYPDAFQ